MKFIVYNSQNVETIGMTIDGWMDKDIHTVILVFSLKNKGNPSICNNMVESGGHYAVWIIQAQKGKYYIILLILCTCTILHYAILHCTILHYTTTEFL